MRKAMLLLGLLALASVSACGAVSNPLAPEGPFTLSGRIWAETSQSEVMLPGASVILTNDSDERSAVSRDDGTFVVDGLSSGRWTVRASKSGYVDEATFVDLAGDTTLNFSLAPR